MIEELISTSLTSLTNDRVTCDLGSSRCFNFSVVPQNRSLRYSHFKMCKKFASGMWSNCQREDQSYHQIAISVCVVSKGSQEISKLYSMHLTCFEIRREPNLGLRTMQESVCISLVCSGKAACANLVNATLNAALLIRQPS